MNEETTLQWVIRANGSEVGRVSPSHSVEIGRKPLRPLADDGMSRIDVPDETRSMSKRHAVFSVSENGAANVRDMASTNGTYVVRDDGGLMRLPQSVDFLLPTSPVRMQFGDVPVDFTRVEQEAPEEPQPAVPRSVRLRRGGGPAGTRCRPICQWTTSWICAPGSRPACSRPIA